MFGQKINSLMWPSPPSSSTHIDITLQLHLYAGGYFPDVPKDMYYCSGFQGQMVAIIPSMDIVIVRMGLKEESDFDFNGMLKGIIGSVNK